MNTKLYKLNKETLEITSSMDLSIENAVTMSIKHIYGEETPWGEVLPFSITILNDYVPELKEEEFMTVIRDTIDITAIGPNDSIINKVGIDKGKIEENSSPHVPLELPHGFIELKGEN